MFIMSLNRQNR